MHLPRLLLGAALVAAFGTVYAPLAAAQGTCGTRDQGNYAVALSTAAVVFPAPGMSHFLAGQVTLPTALQIVIDPGSAVGNNAWYACVRTTDSNLGGYGKPLEDLQFYNSQTGTWVSLSGQYTELAVFQGKDVQTLTLPMRLMLRWADDGPGTYGPTSLVFKFTR